jgi:hypothetical protein
MKRTIALILIFSCYTILSITMPGSILKVENVIADAKNEKFARISQNIDVFKIKYPAKLKDKFPNALLEDETGEIVRLPSARGNLTSSTYLVVELSQNVSESGVINIKNKGETVKPKSNGRLLTPEFVLQSVEFSPILSNGEKAANINDYLKVVAISNDEYLYVEKSASLFQKIMEKVVGASQAVNLYPRNFSDTISAGSKGALEEFVSPKKKNRTMQCGSIGSDRSSAFWLLSSPRRIYALLQVSAEVSRLQIDYELGIGFREKLPQGGDLLFISTKSKYSEFRREAETILLDRTDVKIDFEKSSE